MKKAVGHDLCKQELCSRVLQVLVAVTNAGSGGEPAESVITS
jgi:hypothetical protein